MIDIKARIQQLRLQMLVHSYLYYELNTNLISDHEFDRRGVELANLQSKYPELASQVEYADAFKDWDGSTGAFLPYTDPRIVNIGNRLLNPYKSVAEIPVVKPVSKERKKLF